MNEKPFWKSTFSEADGTGSFSRVGTAFIVANITAMLWYVVVRNGGFPDAALLLALSAAELPLYGANRGTEFLTQATGYFTTLFKK